MGFGTFDVVSQDDGDPERAIHALLKIIRDNFNTQYASQTASLVGFRDAVSTHGGTEVDAILLADFRSHVPLSDYDSYKPFVDKFNAQSCKEEETVNDQEGRKVSDHGRCPWCGLAWSWNAQDISVCRRVQEGGKTY